MDNNTTDFGDLCAKHGMRPDRLGRSSSGTIQRKRKNMTLKDYFVEMYWGAPDAQRQSHLGSRGFSAADDAAARQIATEILCSQRSGFAAQSGGDTDPYHGVVYAADLDADDATIIAGDDVRRVPGVVTI